MKAYPNSPENRLPISLVHGRDEWPLTLPMAKRLLSELSAAVKAVDDHFRCPVLDHVFMGHEFWCYSRGSVKQPNGTYLCKRHAKRAAKEPK